MYLIHNKMLILIDMILARIWRARVVVPLISANLTLIRTTSSRCSWVGEKVECILAGWMTNSRSSLEDREVALGFHKGQLSRDRLTKASRDNGKDSKANSLDIEINDY
jgi:hypothetical protein